MPASSDDAAANPPLRNDAPEHERVTRELQETANRAPAVPPAPARRWWQVWRRG
jgi:hypothetical protein